MKLVTRDIEPELLNMANSYPVVTVIGPRQSGKTTLVKNLFSNKPYVSLENIDERRLAESDPRGFLARYPQGAIFDEIQRLPELLSYIQGIVDEKNLKGMFILTGSHQLKLQESINQSLAGRTAMLKLLPFTIPELLNNKLNFSLDEYIFYGMYPRIFKENIDPTKYYRDYVQTYVERDVRQIINIKDLNVFQHFLKLCAGRIGQVFNSHNLSNELGITHNTIRNWLSVLEASFLVFRLQPYYENFGKRVIKAPKLYFTDVGLASYLLDITSVGQISRDPLRGNLVENLVILECIKHQLNRGVEPSFYYYRDSNNNEVDIIYKKGYELIPIEIKSSKTFTSEFLKGLQYFKNVAQERCTNGYLIYAGEQEQDLGFFKLLNYQNMYKIFH
jgi:predicted AAA+ superfamily ATPase